MYTTIDFKSKKQLKDALAEGTKITCYSPGIFECPHFGLIQLEGPHYPRNHTWWAMGVIEDGVLISVK